MVTSECVIKGCDQPICPFYNVGMFPPQHMKLCVDHNPYIKNEEHREFYRELLDDAEEKKQWAKLAQKASKKWQEENEY